MKVYIFLFYIEWSEQFRQEMASCHVNFTNLSWYRISKHLNSEDLENFHFILFI